MTSLRSAFRPTLCVLGCLVVMAGSAFADISYTLTSGTDVIAFSLPELPAVQTGCNFFGDTSDFCVVPVSLTVDGSHITGNVSFYQPGVGGGITICSGATCTLGSVLVNNNGPGFEQLFSGTLANPTLETFSAIQLTVAGAGDPFYDEAFVLNATTVTAAPEPGSSVALLLGLVGVVLIDRSRRAKQRG